MLELTRKSGQALLIGYATLNFLNIVVLQGAVSFDVVRIVLIAMGATYLVQRALVVGETGFRLEQSELFGFGLVALAGAAIMLQRIFYASYAGFDGIDTLSTIASTWVVCSVWFLAGGVVSSSEMFESKVGALAICALLAVSIFVGLGDAATVDYRAVVDISGTETLSHLTLEKYVVLLLAIAFAMSEKTRPVAILTGFLVLFFMGGRTALAVFGMTVVVLMLRGRLVRNLLVLGGIGLGMLVVAWLAVSMNIIDPQSRAVRDILFLDGFSADNSFMARVYLLTDNLDLLAEQFLFGNFMLSVQRQGFFGGYIHNILSAWQFFGFFFFLALVGALLYSARRARSALARRATPTVLFGAFMLVYVGISMILAKNVTWHLLWFTLGFWMLRPMSVWRRRPAPAASSHASVRRTRGRRESRPTGARSAEPSHRPGLNPGRRNARPVARRT